uniref:Autophagy-related protein 3 n=1 Tax=Proboscia inermis TaxID=420281 RepID=A0A7S0CIH4_9STRA|mmetsp:Transcript_21355/g.24558  ORF Transcript_21355/g.24558 Transcript_21355/m.24558 type:complete len:360 (+) Transcript_21355:67-1146(+)|eukprot:CAMPEP_0171314016 /NCGR_PEP_ID=MMETSP0816-20121228/47755_1 /TAXON_ID=420281 /ORGANISM="Proboscia inermis, Strain CCAP1064/1" /LENGTH=359 /DNA_ID=CAMNT_0011802307 /DNA_START=34 /DNA_END=1113 /DNA_ORIENTATION=+
MTSLFSKAKEFREWAAPTLKSSAFLTRGVLTPEEFVKAGDELVFKCPTWSWEGGDPTRARPYLPRDKQYLLTRNVPCANRAKSLEDSMLGETEVDMSIDLLYTDTDEARAGKGADGGEGWLISHMEPMSKSVGNIQQNNATSSKIDEFDMIDVDKGEGGYDMIVSTSAASSLSPRSDAFEDANRLACQKTEEEDDSEYADMDDFEDDNILQDDVAVMAPTNSESDDLEDDDNIIKTRTYDLSITYDKYYQTPRVWMMGYAEDGISILLDDEMFMDVISDYVKRTVTIENHPHVCGKHMSIHPCQHGAVMKNIVRNLMKDSNLAPEVEGYLFIFLKFVSSIIPTINYDFTMDVTASTRRG